MIKTERRSLLLNGGILPFVSSLLFVALPTYLGTAKMTTREQKNLISEYVDIPRDAYSLSLSLTLSLSRKVTSLYIFSLLTLSHPYRHRLLSVSLTHKNLIHYISLSIFASRSHLPLSLCLSLHLPYTYLCPSFYLCISLTLTSVSLKHWNKASL